jgi:formylglycine-generating enzyme required for sulfatase activity
MGSPETEEVRWEDEGPQHEVTLTEGFWLGETPCTQAFWAAVMGDNPSRFRSVNRPVERVSWEYCQEFFAQLKKIVPYFEGNLPTEAQWEYACRAGTSTAIWIGDLKILGERNAPKLDEIAWYGGNSGKGFDLVVGHDTSDWEEMQSPAERAGSRVVGLKRASPWGLYDMLGNVFEWCADAWDRSTGYPDEARVDPVGNNGSSRVIRGGSWRSYARRVRAASRLGCLPRYRDGNLGFRLSRGPEVRAGSEKVERSSTKGREGDSGIP